MPNHSIEDPFVIDKVLSHRALRCGTGVSDSFALWSTRTAASGLLGS